MMHRMEKCDKNPTGLGQAVNAVTFCGLRRSYITEKNQRLPEDATWGNYPDKPITCPECKRLGEAEDARIKIIVDNLAKGIYPKE